jgi:hypothetical protein
MTHEQNLLELAKREIQLINSTDEIINSILLELTLAVSLAEAYQNTRNSIFWKFASRKTKKRVEQSLNEIAFKAFDHIEEAVRLSNYFIDKNINQSNPLDLKTFNHLNSFKSRMCQVLDKIRNGYLYCECYSVQLKLDL